MFKDAFYFSHDSNARFDTKIIKLRSKFGLEGYGFYFCLLEIMRDNVDYVFDMNDVETLVLQMQLPIDKINAIINYSLEINLLEKDKYNILYSESFLQRMNEMDTLRSKRAEAGRKGGKAKAKLKQNPSKILALKERKGKEIKGKENIFIIPSIEQLKEYCQQRQNKINPNSFFDYYQSKGWMIGKNKMKDWQACIRTWEAKEQKEVLPYKREEKPYNAFN